jgi:outer membrane protein assembly factor BamD (BamD/ComL family)
MLETRPNTQGTVFQLRAILGRVQRELENFSKTENFDSALRLRLAMAYQGLGRYRESALILEDMLASMPPDPLVESATLAQVQCWMETKHWTRAIAAAERYEEVFGVDGKSLATVLFLKAEALRENLDYGAAQLAYGELVERFPGDPFAGKAMFMQGFQSMPPPGPGDARTAADDASAALSAAADASPAATSAPLRSA